MASKDEVLKLTKELQQVNIQNCKNGLTDNAAFELTRAACRNLMYREVENTALKDISDISSQSGTAKAKSDTGGSSNIALIAVGAVAAVGLVVGIGYWAFFAE
jgi:hypothetical protein